MKIKQHTKQLSVWIISILISLMPNFAWSEPATTEVMADTPAKVYFSRTKLQLGESTTLYVRGENIKSAFTPAIVSQLKKYLMLFQISGDEDSIRVILYPQKAGTFTFPAIKAGRIQLPPQTFTILPNPKVKVKWQKDTDQLFERQTLNWQVTAQFSEPTLRGKLLLFETSAKTTQLPQIEDPNYRALSSGSHVFEKQLKDGSVMQTFTAAITFKKAGKIRTVNPYLEVKNASQRPWRFFPYPDRHHLFHVKPLPSYLPPNIVVGQLQLTAQPLKPWLETGDLIYWSLQLQGQSIPTFYLPSLDSQLTTDNGQPQWLANQIQKSEILTPKGLVSQVKIEQPLRFLNWGQHQLPEIRLLSFDPNHQKVQTTLLPAQTVWVWPTGLGIVLQLVIFLLGIGLLSFSIWGLTLHQQYQRWNEQVQRAETPQQLWCALQNCINWMLDKNEIPCHEKQTTLGFPVQQTFQTYYSALKSQKDSIQNHIPEWTETLNQQLFDSSKALDETAFLTLKQAALNWCKQQTVWQKIRFNLTQLLKHKRSSSANNSGV